MRAQKIYFQAIKEKEAGEAGKAGENGEAGMTGKAGKTGQQGKSTKSWTYTKRSLNKRGHCHRGKFSQKFTNLF